MSDPCIGDAPSYIASEPDLMQRFPALTHIEAHGIRQAAAQPGLFVRVLDFLLANEPTPIAFCQNSATEPEIVQTARDKLDSEPAR